MFIFFISLAYAEYREAFSIKIHDKKVGVVSTKEIFGKVAVNFDNQSLGTIRGKIFKMDDKKEVSIQYLAVQSQKSKVVEFNFDKGKRYFYRQESPPFQDVELIPGKKSYEIPPQL